MYEKFRDFQNSVCYFPSVHRQFFEVLTSGHDFSHTFSSLRFLSLKQAQDHLGSKEVKIKYSRLAATWLKVVEVDCYSTGYAKAMSTIIEHFMSFEIKRNTWNHGSQIYKAVKIKVKIKLFYRRTSLNVGLNFYWCLTIFSCFAWDWQILSVPDDKIQLSILNL